MSSTLAVPSVVLGDQRPQLFAAPRSPWSEGARIRKLAADAGLLLDPWQEHVLDIGLGRRDDDMWAAFEVALIVSRQNGKGAILEALELAALFLDDFIPPGGLILHSAHEFKTAAEAFLRIRTLITDNPQYERRVERIRTATGYEAIELKNKKRLRFVARSKGSGRGFTSDLVIMDEAYNLGSDQMAALLPTLSTRPNPQVWYASTAGTETSTQLARLRKRGQSGSDPSLAFFEWSAEEDPERPGLAIGMDDPDVWARANPGMGIRISAEYIARERAALDDEAFARERLGIGVYPADLANAWLVMRKAQWFAALDPWSQIAGRPALAVAVSPDSTSSCIAMAGRRPDGLMHAELTEPPRQGTDGLVAEALRLAGTHDPCVLVLNGGGAALALQRELEEHHFAVKPGPRDRQLQITGPREYAQACGALAQDVTNGRFRHLDQPPLDAAVAGAQLRELTDAWAWSWKDSGADIGPLEAVTLARHGFMTFGVHSMPEPDIF